MVESVSPSAPYVGLIGLGTMGRPIALRLCRSGLPLVVHNRTRTRAEPVLEAGATWAESPRVVARAVAGGVVLVMLSDAHAVRSVLFGRGGLASAARPGTLVVNLSTIGPDESRSFAERLAGRDLRYVEAPVGGSEQVAADGELLAFVGGAPEDVDRARPVLERFTRRVELVGPVGAGTAMKLVNNLITISTVAVDAEALALAEALGLDRQRTVDLLLDGGAASTMLENKREAFLREDYIPRFKLALAVKDLRLIGRTARAVGVRTGLAREARRLADTALRSGLGERDFASIFEAARSRADGGAKSGSAAPTTPATPA